MTVQFLTISELKDLIKRKKISYEELMDETFHLIKKYSSINSFITLNQKQALINAKKLDKNNLQNSLTGIPIAQKDLFCTKGLKTTCGSKMLSNFVPPYDATVVSKLNNAGSICIGKTNMDEFAMGSSNETSFYGNVHNPWKFGYVPGGSSGGSAAAVAAGLVPAATGTDTGGSIRQPAALCGLTGIKPTYGRVSRWGMIAFASSLDQGGPICRNVEDCVLLLDAMSGYDEKDTTSLKLDSTKIHNNINESLEHLNIGIVNEFKQNDLSTDSQNYLVMLSANSRVWEQKFQRYHYQILLNLFQLTMLWLLLNVHLIYLDMMV